MSINEEDYIIKDIEIAQLAAMSNKYTAYISEEYNDGKYSLMLVFLSADRPEGVDDHKILISSTDKERYTELKRKFYRKFVHYGGSIKINF